MPVYGAIVVIIGIKKTRFQTFLHDATTFFNSIVVLVYGSGVIVQRFTQFLSAFRAEIELQCLLQAIVVIVLIGGQFAEFTVTLKVGFFRSQTV